MSDIIDQASESEEWYRQVALRDFGNKNTVQGPSLIHCISCGEEIEARRRHIIPGCTQCVTCKDKEESRSRHRASARRYHNE
ncbi:TraR/DksA C4-type zinc finger protein [Cedecea sp. NFIX57]|uniref:TraR/DksA C4-type zinc finger protein n=1 Tax=Cedecea sp. NFIX57 TaxID=1566286 RepID=UPI000A0A6967|nr:TraR/DksA C4-type zinc finger protein [Cedecea sp. NFIX57]SMG55518.1 transcriptional regulator, TraR/DksA family [Cedecea sp. NFIX57]